MSIHSQAIVHPNAKIADDVTIEAYSVIGEDVEIEQGCWIGSHVVIYGPTKIGKNNKIYPFACLGGDPQHKKYANEKTSLVIGDNNVIREYVTFHRGTTIDEGITIIGNDSWFMAYTHIAHDCKIGNNVIFANACALAGHVIVGDYVILGGLTAIHQFSHLGEHCFTAGGTIVTRDIPPYVMAAGNSANANGINKEGLRRRGFSQEVIEALHKAYRFLIYSRMPRQQAFEKVADLEKDYVEVKAMADFIRNSKRGIVR